MTDETGSRKWENDLLLYKGSLDIILSQNKGSVWKYDIGRNCLELVKGKHIFFSQGKIIENIPESLFTGNMIHTDTCMPFKRIFEDIQKGMEMAECTIKVKTPQNAYQWQKISIKRYLGEEETSYAVLYAIDIPIPLNMEKQYFQEEQLRTMLSEDVIASSKVNLTKNLVEYLWAANVDKENLEKAKTYEQMYQLGYKSICSKDDKKRYEKIFNYQTLLTQKRSSSNPSMECRYKDPTGKIQWVIMNASILPDEKTGDLMYYSFIRNIDLKKKLELALLKKAERDKVTGLYNKTTVELLIREAIYQNRDSNVKSSIIILDIDNFERINESYGHPFGDYVLLEIGRILINIFGNGSIIGRMEEDEFIIFIASVVSEEEVANKIEEIFSSFRQGYQESLVLPNLKISAGCAFSEAAKASFTVFFEEAKFALYDAKAKGKNQYVLYEQKQSPIIANGINSCMAKDFLSRCCMMEELEEMVFIIDDDNYDLLYMNQAAKEKFPEADLKGQVPKCYQTLHGFSVPCSFCNRHIEEGNKFNVCYNTNYKLQHRYIIKEKLMVQGKKRYRFELFFDAEQLERVNHSQMPDIVLRSIEVLISVNDFEKAIKSVLQNIGFFYEADRVYVMELDSNFQQSSLTFEWCAEAVMLQERSSPDIDLMSLPRWKEAMKNNIPVIFSDKEEADELYAAEYDMLKRHHIDSIIVVPFEVKDMQYGHGFLGIENPNLNKGGITFLTALAFLTGMEISRRRLREKQIYVNVYDTLTGLLNRNSYLDYMRNLSVDALSSMGIISADINGLKNINQKYGYSYGDGLIKYISDVLKKVFSGCSIFRFSGDEFLILCKDMTQEAFQRMLKNAREEIEHQYPGSLSIGSAWTDSDFDIERMIFNSEELMMISKRKYYLNNKKESTYVHPYVLDELLMALSKHRYVMFLQPKVDICTGQLSGAEALVRYENEDGKIIGPAEFVPILEQEHYIHYIDFFIFEETCKLLKRWKEQGYTLIPISLNFSRSTLLETGIIEEMNRISDKYQVSREYIEVEITESFGGVEQETIKEVGHCIVNNHYRLSLDDFGAKYSNISILSLLKLDILKLDKTLVSSLYVHPPLKVIVKNLIITCHQIDVKCVAEGVETEEQLQTLKELECDYAQGYLFNKPVPVSDFENRYMYK